MVVGVMVVVFRVVVVVEKVRLAGWVDRLLAADGADSGGEPPPGVYHGDLRERVEAQHVDLDGHVGSVVWGRRKKGRKKNRFNLYRHMLFIPLYATHGTFGPGNI